jgi:60 kDa SS-A/Ro ribonucleoprotein
MLNKLLFAKSAKANDLTVNAAGGAAHAFDAKHALAQLAITGTLNDTYYADAKAQLDELLAHCFNVTPEFIAKTAVYARQNGRMKDTPVLLLAWLAAFDGALCAQVFDRVIDNGAQLRSFVQALRSGVVARKSLGSRPKRLVQHWLERASDETLIHAMVGNAPSLADVIKMVHPRAASVERAALYGYIIGKDVDVELLPQALREFEAFKQDPSKTVPKVPFQMLTAQPLSKSHWCAIAKTAGWTMTRMNLNTFARHGVFDDRKLVDLIAARLADPKLIAKAQAFPYQLLTTWQATAAMPEPIRAALREAMEIAVGNVPKLKGTVAIAVDVSGSMSSPVTGLRQGATTRTRCVDVAGLMAAAVLAKHPGAIVLPFNDRVRPWGRPKSNSVIETAEALARLLGGGTAVSAPIAELNRLRFAPDTVLIVSDNQSWIDHRGGRETATEVEWRKLRGRNPDARLVCIDLQPYTNTQSPDDDHVLNVGGFGDGVWQVIAGFSHGLQANKHFVDAVERVDLNITG